MRKSASSTFAKAKTHCSKRIRILTTNALNFTHFWMIFEKWVPTQAAAHQTPNAFNSFLSFLNGWKCAFNKQSLTNSNALTLRCSAEKGIAEEKAEISAENKTKDTQNRNNKQCPLNKFIITPIQLSKPLSEWRRRIVAIDTLRNLIIKKMEALGLHHSKVNAFSMQAHGSVFVVVRARKDSWFLLLHYGERNYSIKKSCMIFSVLTHWNWWQTKLLSHNLKLCLSQLTYLVQWMRFHWYSWFVLLRWKNVGFFYWYYSKATIVQRPRLNQFHRVCVLKHSSHSDSHSIFSWKTLRNNNMPSRIDRRPLSVFHFLYAIVIFILQQNPLLLTNNDRAGFFLVFRMRIAIFLFLIFWSSYLIRKSSTLMSMSCSFFKRKKNIARNQSSSNINK